MGGYGSGRWSWHTKKMTVEDCYKLSMKTIHAYLHPGFYSRFWWMVGDREVGSINYRVTGNDEIPKAIQLIYTNTDRWTDEKTNLDYSVRLTTTLTPWGTLRYWFVCPLTKSGRICSRRVGVLYLPPGGKYFGCRHCYDLTYQSCQEKNTTDLLSRLISIEMLADYPYLSLSELTRLIHCDLRGKKIPKGIHEKILAAVMSKFLASVPDPYANYLTAVELCKLSGLKPSDLVRLESFRLLLPDHDGKYRPKLAGWARKIAYLLAEGWSLDEIRGWAKGRWSISNPRIWPPTREDWKP